MIEPVAVSRYPPHHPTSPSTGLRFAKGAEPSIIKSHSMGGHTAMWCASRLEASNARRAFI